MRMVIKRDSGVPSEAKPMGLNERLASVGSQGRRERQGWCHGFRSGKLEDGDAINQAREGEERVGRGGEIISSV